MNARWFAVPTLLVLALGCSSTRSSITTQSSLGGSSASANDTMADSSVDASVDNGELPIRPLSQIPYARLNMLILGECVITGQVQLPDGTSNDISACTGAGEFEPDFHVFAGWEREPDQTVREVIDSGDRAVFLIDGVEQMPAGYADTSSDGHPIASTFWVREGMTGTHELKLILYRQGVVVHTSIIRVTFGGDAGANGDGADGVDTGLTGEIVFDSDADGDKEIYVMDLRNGTTRQLTDNTWADSAPAWSPDGEQIVFASNRDGNYDIFVMDSDGSDQTPITRTTAKEARPAWRPDGKYLAWESDADGNKNIYVWEWATGTTTQCTNDPADETEAHFAGGDLLGEMIFTSMRTGNGDLYMMACRTQTPVRPGEVPPPTPPPDRLTHNDYYEGFGSLSPDGTQLLYHTNEAGGFGAYTASLTSSAYYRVTSLAGWQAAPAWSPDATQIVVVDRSRGMESSDICIVTLARSVTTCPTSGSTANQEYPSFRPTG